MPRSVPPIVSIPLADLLLDQENARIEEQRNQQDAVLALTGLNADHMLNLAASIVEKGMLDPLAMPGVMAAEGQKKKYLVIEGNRRIAALKILESPSLISPVLSSAQKTRLNKLAAKYEDHPFGEIDCRLFDSIEEAEYWVTNRHTGANDGVGLKDWGSEEQDRWDSRHGRRSHYVQMADFADRFYDFSREVRASKRKIVTNLNRIASAKGAQQILGIERKNKLTSTYYPADETAKWVGYIITLLKKGQVDVNDIRTAKDVEALVKGWPSAVLPDASKRMVAPVPLDDFTHGRVPPDGKKASEGSKSKPSEDDSSAAFRKRRKRRPRPRGALIPPSCHLDIPRPRVNNVYVELSRMSHNDYTEAVSVLLRVFLELSTDFYIEKHNIVEDKDGLRRKIGLARKLKEVSKHLRSRGKITQDLKEAVDKMADSDRYIHASVVVFHQYVHNQHASPVASELETVWDNTLQPFLEGLFAP